MKGKKAEHPLYRYTAGDIITYQGKKYRVTDNKRYEYWQGVEDHKMETVYIYPYLPYHKENQSNTGFFLPTCTII